MDKKYNLTYEVDTWLAVVMQREELIYGRIAISRTDRYVTGAKKNLSRRDVDHSDEVRVMKTSNDSETTTMHHINNR